MYRDKQLWCVFLGQVKVLVTSSSYEPNMRFTGFTPLMEAVCSTSAFCGGSVVFMENGVEKVGGSDEQIFLCVGNRCLKISTIGRFPINTPSSKSLQVENMKVAMLDMLLEAGEDINIYSQAMEGSIFDAYNRVSGTPLMHACKHASEEGSHIVEYLVAHGADVMLLNVYGFRALDMECGRQSVREGVVRCLIKAGAPFPFHTCLGLCTLWQQDLLKLQTLKQEIAELKALPTLVAGLSEAFVADM